MAASAKSSSLVLKKFGSFLLLLVMAPLAMAEEPVHHQAGLVSQPEPDDSFLVTFESLWESRYVSEGTDNLDGAGILSELLTVDLGAFHTHVWQGSATTPTLRK